MQATKRALDVCTFYISKSATRLRTLQQQVAIGCTGKEMQTIWIWFSRQKILLHVTVFHSWNPVTTSILYYNLIEIWPTTIEKQPSVPTCCHRGVVYHSTCNGVSSPHWTACPSVRLSGKNVGFLDVQRGTTLQLVRGRTVGHYYWLMCSTITNWHPSAIPNLPAVCLSLPAGRLRF
jgi:hypothetical protein